MPDVEISASLSDVDDSRNRSVTISAVGAHIQRLRHTIGFAAEETITIDGDITGGQGPGVLLIENKDATNFVKVGRTTLVYFSRIPAGAFALVPLEPTMTQLFIIADTANVDVDLEIREA